MEGDHKIRAGLAGCALGLLTVVLYAPLIGWGCPHATAADRVKTFATDEILPLEPLAEMHNTFVVSKPDRNYGYPWWHYFVVAVAYAPYLLYLWLTGGLESPRPEYPFGLKDPVGSLYTLTIIGRMVTVLMAAGVVAAAYHFSRILWNHACGMIAAVLTMLSYLMVYYGRTGNLDVPAMFWTSLGLVLYARIVVSGITPRRAGWLGVFGGLAMATKDQALVVFLPLGLALLLPQVARASRGAHLRSLFAGLGASVAAYLVGTGMLVDPARHVTHVRRLLFEPQLVTAAAFYWPAQPLTWSGIAALTGDLLHKLAAMTSLPVLAAASLGVVAVLRFERRVGVFLLVGLALFLLLVLPTGLVVRRYLLPLSLILDAFAARGLLALRGSRWRPVWGPALAVLLGWRALVAADLAYAQVRETRTAAATWFAGHARAGERVEYFGNSQNLPHLSRQIATRRIAGRQTWEGQSDHAPAVLEYLARDGPEYVVVIPDWTSHPGMPRSQDCPEPVYAALLDGSVGYALVAHFPTPALLRGPLRRPPLDNPSVSPPVRIFARADVAERVGIR